MRRLIPAFLALLLFSLVVYLGIQKKEEEVHQLKGSLVGKPAPDFTLKTLDGREISLKDFKGKVVLINFWATWCPPCREELPLFERLYKKYKDKGFVILAVNTDPENLQDFLKDYGENLSFPILIGNDDILNKYPVRGLPTSILIDREGKIVKVRLGIYRELEEDIKKLL
ncbi:TlpA disulfide reductase family protein [Aquifex sp.]